MTTFVLPYSWVQQAGASFPIDPVKFDTQDNAIAGAINNCIFRDGTSTISASTPWNGFGITGLLDPVNAQDAATKNYVTGAIANQTSPTINGPAIVTGIAVNSFGLRIANFAPLSGTGWGLDFSSGESSGTFIAMKFGSGILTEAYSGSITYTPSATSYNTTSDARLKENIAPFVGGLASVLAMKPVEFNFIGQQERVVGFIAQDHHKVAPEAVHVGGDDPQTDPWGMDYGRNMPRVIAAIQELKAEFDAYKASHP